MVGYLSRVKSRYLEVKNAKRNLRIIESAIENAEYRYFERHDLSIEDVRRLYLAIQELENEWTKEFLVYSKGYIVYPLFGFSITTESVS